MADIYTTIEISNGPQQTISAIATNGIYQGGLLVDWRGKDFTNNPQTTALLDRSGNGRTGTVTGFTYNGTTDGSDGNGAIIFTNDAIDKSIMTSTRINPIPVIEAVFKLPATPINWASIVNAYGATTEAWGIAFFVHSTGVLGLHYWDGSTRHFDLFSDVSFSQNRKYHALLQYNADTDNLDFYLNGILTKRVNVPGLVLGNAKFATGNWGYIAGDAYDWSGLLYEARAYSAPLTPEQILNNASVSLGLKRVDISNGTGQTIAAVGNKGISLSYGTSLKGDPTFKRGLNGLGLYNNTGDGSVVFTRIEKPADAPTDSTHAFRITTTGSTSQPGAGGFYTLVQSSANKIFIGKFIAKIPPGKSLEWTSNDIGDNGSYVWLTSKIGTGNFETYIHKTICGPTGSFGVTEYYFTNPGGDNVTDFALATIYDATNAPGELSAGAQLDFSFVTSMPKHATASILISNGTIQTIAIKKSVARVVTITNGTGQTLTETTARKIVTTISNGAQMNIIYSSSRPRYAVVTVSNGPQIAMTTRHQTNRTLLLSHGPQQTIATLHNAKRIVAISNGTGQTFAIIHKGTVFATISNGAQLIFNATKKTTASATISNGPQFALVFFAGIPFIVNQADEITATINMRETITAVHSVRTAIPVTINTHDSIIITLPKQRGV